MRPRHAITPLLLTAVVLSPGSAFAQSSFEQQLQDAAGGGATAQTEAPAQPGTTPSETDVPATPPDGAIAAPPPAAIPDPGADLAQATTPVPPPYLTAGPGAATQPVAAVAQLTEPDVSLPALRIATLLSALLVLLAIAVAGILRATGLRTAAHEPVDVQPPGPAGRLGAATRSVADDMRDFLRRSR